MGISEEVLTDQGTQCMSECILEVSRLPSIKGVLPTCHIIPFVNRLVEKWNGTLKSINPCLRGFVKTSQSNKNKITEVELERMTMAEDLFCQLGGKKYLSKIDLTKGYWPVAQED